MLVILILMAVLLAPVWGARLKTRNAARVATATGWALAMGIVILGAVAQGTTGDLDPGFWIFNSVLLVVALGLARLGERWKRQGANSVST